MTTTINSTLIDPAPGRQQHDVREGLEQLFVRFGVRDAFVKYERPSKACSAYKISVLRNGEIDLHVRLEGDDEAKADDLMNELGQRGFTGGFAGRGGRGDGALIHAAIGDARAPTTNTILDDAFRLTRINTYTISLPALRVASAMR
jgi:hypothetical protein